jgi:hypothetical protein
LAIFGAAPLPAQAATEVTVVNQVPAVAPNPLYISNKSPLSVSPLVELPIGSVVPEGWLRHMLQLEADGMGGRLEEISPFLKFQNNGWVAADGKDGWEELPYWLKGYGDLGYVLNDPRIIENAKKWINGILARQDDDGWFGPEPLRTAIKGKPDMWPHMPILNALQSFYEFTGDPRVIPFMTKYFKWQNSLPGDDFRRSWQETRFGDNLESIYWVYNHTGESWLLDLAQKMHENSANWTRGVANWHNVNFSQGFREPAEYGMQGKDPKFLAATERNYQKAMGIYGQFPGGGFAADENARPGFVDPRQGFETCGIVEFMHSFEMLSKISGDPLWLDRCEYIAFNSLPAALTPDLKALHYLTPANVVQLDKNNKSPGIQNRGTMISYSPYQVYRCCQHNHVMGWPYYAEHLWMATADGGLAASLYNASEVSAKVGAGSTVKIAETTDYPFSDTVQLKVATDKPISFPLYLRVPAWCENPSVTINGQVVQAEAKPESFMVINRSWSDGDSITLTLPMKLAVKRWEKNNDSASVNYGPLSFSLEIGENWVKYGGNDQWPEEEVYPTTPWNYGLVLDANDPATSFELVKKPGPIADQPFTAATAPLEIHARGQKVDAWQTDRNQLLRPLQPSPVKSDEPVESITLIPMGAARLRISAFPVIGTGSDAHEWSLPASQTGPAADSRLTASYDGPDNLEALNDGILSASSSDETIPRFTWWDHKGTDEWVQYDFKGPQDVTGVEVYWFDDTGHGQCRVPASWQVLYRDGNAWKPVEADSPGGVDTNRFNLQKFKKVSATALRLEVKLQEGFSGGVLQWRVR